jgi:hypothetical protein
VRALPLETSPCRPGSIAARSCHAAASSLLRPDTAPRSAWLADNSAPATRRLLPAADCPAFTRPITSTRLSSFLLNPVLPHRRCASCRRHSKWGHFYCGFMGTLLMWFNRIKTDCAEQIGLRTQRWNSSGSCARSLSNPFEPPTCDVRRHTAEGMLSRKPNMECAITFLGR